jgi:hypothetical protein
VLVEAAGLATPHATVALLDHLRQRNESVEGNVDSLGLDDVGQKGSECKHDTSNRVFGAEVGVNKAVEVDAQTIDNGSTRDGLLKVTM